MEKRRFIKRNVKNGSYTREMIYHENGDYFENINVTGDIHLFRYRSDNELNIKSFINNEFWSSLPVAFNDPYDGYLTFDIKRFINETEENKTLINDKNALYEVNKLATFYTKKMSYITSLSEKITNTTMWSHYSGNAKGFAVEYNLENLQDAMDIYLEYAIRVLKEHYSITEDEINTKTWEKYKLFQKRLLPVKYSTKAFDFTDEMIKERIDLTTFERGDLINAINRYNDDEFFKNNRSIRDHIAVTKNPNWSYEREWRLIVGNILSGPDHEVMALVPPVAIYLGEHISDTNKFILVNAAVKKEIPIYQMKTTYSKTTNKLRPYKLKQFDIDNILDFKNFSDFKLL